jgi:opacity protein-like surface antigen
MVAMIRRTRWSFLLGLIGVLAAGRADAQVVRSPFRYVDTRQSVTVFGGYVLTDRGRLDLGPEDAPIGGVRYSLRLGGPFTAEASASYLPSTRTVLDTTAVGSPLERVGEANIDLALIDVALRFNLTGPRTYHNLMPYLIAGGGVAFEVAGDDDAESEIAADARFDFGTRFAGQVGAGVEWYATRRLALRFDARDVFWKLKTPPAFSRQDPGNVPGDEWVQNFAFSLGLAFHF